MWRMDTLWFDVAVVMSIFAAGNICFGHFEEHNGWTGEPKDGYYQLIGHTPRQRT